MSVQIHPYTEDTYEYLADGTVRVVDVKSGLEGVFSGTGRWVTGDLTWADPHMIIFTYEQGRAGAGSALT